MKKLSPLAKTLIALGAVAGAFLYLLIVDLGVNAGRIHYGVSVSGFDLGGMTSQEAVRALNRRRTLLRREEICFKGPSFNSCAQPARLGWSPDPSKTAEEALRVGREGATLRALADRARAWLGGVKVQWDTGPRASRVTRLVDDWEQELGNVAVDRERLRFRIKRAILTYPRRLFRIPVDG